MESEKKFALTDDTLCKGLILQRSQAKVTNLHGACSASNEDVVTLQVSMYNRWCSCMKIQQALQYLPAPVLQHFHVYLLEPFNIPEMEIISIIVHSTISGHHKKNPANPDNMPEV